MVAYPWDVSWERTALAHGGNIFFVGNAGANEANDPANGDHPDRPFATLDYAFSRCTANNGDVIYVLPGHAETTTNVGIDVAGVKVVGLGVGRNRPTFTATTGASALFAVSAANCWLENLRLVGAASGVTAHINIAAADLTVKDCVFSHSATPLNSINIASGADRFTFTGCRWKGTADGPDTVVNFAIGSSSITEWLFDNCQFNYLPNGLDKCAFLASLDACPGGIIKDCTLIGLDLEGLFVDFNSSVSVGEGIIQNCFAQYRVAATIADLLDLGGYSTANFRGCDGPNRAAQLLPATSAT